MLRNKKKKNQAERLAGAGFGNRGFTHKGKFIQGGGAQFSPRSSTLLRFRLLSTTALCRTFSSRCAAFAYNRLNATGASVPWLTTPDHVRSRRFPDPRRFERLVNMTLALALALAPGCTVPGLTVTLAVTLAVVKSCQLAKGRAGMPPDSGTFVELSPTSVSSATSAVAPAVRVLRGRDHAR
jgi:hypothetical protein